MCYDLLISELLRLVHNAHKKFAADCNEGKRAGMPGLKMKELIKIDHLVGERRSMMEP